MDIAKMIMGGIDSLLDKVIPDADERAKMAHKIATMASQNAHEVALAQISVNQQEAAHKSLFVAGWRPALGWVCALGYFFTFIGAPMGEALFGWNLPDLDIAGLASLTFGMLGLSGMRSYEKARGVNRND